MSEPNMVMQGSHRPTSIFVRGRKWASLTELLKLIIQPSRSSSNSKTEPNTKGEKSRILVKLLGRSESQRLVSGVK